MIKNFAEYVAPGEVGSFDEIEPGRGAIVRQGLKKVAAYRDEAGAIHAFSAACTHSAATCTGIHSSSAGTVRATGHSSASTGQC